MTLRMVAEKAGVAVDTVRKVVRGDPTVRPYIRQRVQKVIVETGYRPNLVARALRQSHLDLVPLSIMSIDQPYFGRIARRMSELIVDWGAEPALCLDSKHLMTLFKRTHGMTMGEWRREKRGQVCIASRGKVKKLCMEVNAGTSADVSIRALRGSGGLKSP